MRWYDIFSTFYDRSLESLYRDARREAGKALALSPGDAVLDAPCGTGLSFDVLAEAVGERGQLIGLDRSRGMASKAKARAHKHTWSQVIVEVCDVHDVDPTWLARVAGREQVDGVLVFLGLTAFPDWARAFERLYGCLRAGGRFVIVDVFAESPDLQGRMVNLIAQADIRRRVWEPLEALAGDFERTPLPPRSEYGGELYVAAGTKTA